MEFNDLPEWIKTLWNVDAKLAREAELYYENSVPILRIIIAGGRDYIPNEMHKLEIQSIIQNYAKDNHIVIVSGCAKGADSFGESLAREWGFSIRRYQANWESLGKSAGPIRNKTMAQNADVCILLPGGKGTANMKYLAEKYKLKIFEIADNPTFG